MSGFVLRCWRFSKRRIGLWSNRIEMNENPYQSSNTHDAPHVRNRELRLQLHWWLVGLAGVVFGLGAWHFRLGIPSMHPAFGGPDPIKVVMVLAIFSLGCLVLAVVIMIRAVCTRNMRYGLLAIVPLLFVAASVAEFLRAAL